VSAGGSTLVPCGAEGSATCTTAAAALRAPSGSRTAVTVTVLPDGAPTAIVER
jgi:UDP-N-acetylmuramyl tripeptide synthase